MNVTPVTVLLGVIPDSGKLFVLFHILCPTLMEWQWITGCSIVALMAFFAFFCMRCLLNTAPAFCICFSFVMPYRRGSYIGALSLYLVIHLQAKYSITCYVIAWLGQERVTQLENCSGPIYDPRRYHKVTKKKSKMEEYVQQKSWTKRNVGLENL